MSKTVKRSTDKFDESELFSDQDFDVHSFIDSMEAENGRRERQRRVSKISRQRIDEWQEAKWLRLQLQDWEDWADE